MSLLPYEIAKAAEARRVPVDVHWDLNTVCQHDCVMCYWSDAQQGLSTADVKQVLDALAGAGCLFLTLSGGEIFLREDILEILDHATDRGFVVTVKTNGTLLTEDQVRIMAGMGIYEVHISLHAATAKVQDKVTRTPGSFDKAVRSIEWCVRAGIKTNIMCVLLHGHLDEWAKVQELAERMGVDEVVATPFMFAGTDGDAGPFRYQLSDAELKSYYLNMYHAGQGACPGDGDLSDPLANLPEEERQNDLAISCAVIRRGVTLRPNGDVIPCTWVPRVLGNILRTPIRDILHSPQADEVIEMIRLKNNPECSVCCDKMSCFRCPGLALMEHGDAQRPPSEGCRHVRIQKEILHEAGR
jgi:MoaA/NifB/PqqE/SkfB family radical SAM enzyme